MFYGWFIVIAAFVTLTLTVGIPFYGMPFFYDYFTKEFGWSRAQTTSGIALATILIQPLGAFYIHRFSPRRLILFGSFMLCLSMIIFSRGDGSLWLYYLGWAAFMVGYLCAGPLPHQVILSQWFRRNRGFAIGIAYLGLGLGGAISQKYVALPLIERYGWRSALVCMGLLILAVVPLALFVVRDRASDRGLPPDGDTAAEPIAETAPLPFGDITRTRQFWLLALGSCASIGAIGSINQHMKLIFLDAGLTAATVADTTFLILVSSLAGRVIMGWLADRYPKKWVMLAAYLMVGLPVPLLYLVGQAGIAPAFAIVFGFGLGADYMLIPLMAAQLFGVNSLARVMAVVLPLDSIGQTCFPFLIGMMRDRSGSYGAGLAIVCALALAGACAVALLPERRNETGTLPVK